MKTDYIPEKIRKFLTTPEGKAAFREITGNISKHTRAKRKEVFLSPPANVRRWLYTMELLKKSERKSNK